jgi:hypothetical protein
LCASWEDITEARQKHGKASRRAHLIVEGGYLILLRHGFRAGPYLQGFQQKPLGEATIVAWLTAKNLVLYFAVAGRFWES